MSAGKYLAYLTVVSTFALIVWGAYLTAGDWGGACGTGSSSAISSDWPFCNGSLAVPDPSTNYGALVEYVHRTLSVVTGVILLVTTVVVWRMKPRPAAAARALLLSLALLAIQILLGNVVVNSDLDPVITAIHLANATVIFGVMVIAGLLIHLAEKRPA